MLQGCRAHARFLSAERPVERPLRHLHCRHHHDVRHPVSAKCLDEDGVGQPGVRREGARPLHQSQGLLRRLPDADAGAQRGSIAPAEPEARGPRRAHRAGAPRRRGAPPGHRSDRPRGDRRALRRLRPREHPGGRPGHRSPGAPGDVSVVRLRRDRLARHRDRARERRRHRHPGRLSRPEVAGLRHEGVRAQGAQPRQPVDRRVSRGAGARTARGEGARHHPRAGPGERRRGARRVQAPVRDGDPHVGSRQRVVGCALGGRRDARHGRRVGQGAPGRVRLDARGAAKRRRAAGGPHPPHPGEDTVRRDRRREGAGGGEAVVGRGAHPGGRVVRRSGARDVRRLEQVEGWRRGRQHRRLRPAVPTRGRSPQAG